MATYYSRTTGNWNNRFTWSTISHGGSAATAYPTSSDIVNIGSTHSVTVPVDSACATLNFENTSSLSINASYQLTVTNNITIYSLTTTNNIITIDGDGIISCTNLNIGTNINPSATRTTTLNSSINTFNVTGNLNLYSNTRASFFNNAIFNLNSGTLTLNGSVVTTNENASNNSQFYMNQSTQNATLILNNATPFILGGVGISTINFNGTGNTVNYNYAGNVTCYPTTYNNLTISGSGEKTTTDIIVNGVFTLKDTAIQAGTIPTYGANSAIKYNGSTTQTTGGELPLIFNGAGGIIIDNVNGVNLNANLTVNGIFNSIDYLSIGTHLLTLNGEINCGVLVGGATSDLTIGTGTTEVNIPSVSVCNFIVNRDIKLCGNVTVLCVYTNNGFNVDLNGYSLITPYTRVSTYIYSLNNKLIYIN